MSSRVELAVGFGFLVAVFVIAMFAIVKGEGTREKILRDVLATYERTRVSSGVEQLEDLKLRVGKLEGMLGRMEGDGK